MITENNKIIAEFMECEKSTSVGSKVLIIGESDFSGQIGQYTGITQENSTGVYLSKDGSTRWFDLDEIKNIDFKDVKNYHSDWNWLMEVVHKITILEEFQEWEFNSLFWEVFCQIDITEIYNQVVLFIEYYNEIGG